MLDTIIVALVVYLLLTHCLKVEGITNYNQIRSDYGWSDHYSPQFDDIHGRTINDSGLMR